MNTSNSQKLQGILYILLSGFFFSLMTLFVRLAGDLPTMQKAFFRNAIAVVVSVLLLARTPERFTIKKSSWPGLFARAGFGTISLISNFYVIDHLGLADANILNKLSPFFAIIVSVFLLSEKANVVEWLSVFIAFVGAAFVIKPSLSITSVYGLIGLFGGICAGVAMSFLRKLGKSGERGPVIVMFFSCFSCLVTIPFFIASYKPMSVKQLLFLLAAGASATGGQLSITKAYTKSPAKEISIFDYSQILFAAIWGFCFFGELPDYLSLIGYAIIIGIAIFKWQYTLRRSPED